MLMEFLSFEMPMVKKSIKAMPSTRQCFLLARPPASRFLQSNQFQCSALAQSVKSATSHSQISFRVDPVFLKNFKLDASESDRGGGGGGGEQIKLME